MAALGNLDARILADGELDLAAACAERGTLVVTPTHSSNMDSPAIGFGLLRAGLPPTTYGAGKNLFTNPFISFFMRNLGAYRVDRRLKFELYKDVLKKYSTVLLEHGYHSLFFPGGTRCRSNIVEKHLKLGLLGTAVTAYKNSVREGTPNKRLYFVPVTINYRLVLEAETLIDDYLAETGKSRYIITDDEFSRIGRIVEFFRKILAHEGSVVVRFGRPLDPFGNDITDDGESIDRAGRAVDPGELRARRRRRGHATTISATPSTRARSAAGSPRRIPRLTVFHSTHLVARALYDAIAARAGTRDIYRLLRLPPPQLAVEADRVARLGGCARGSPTTRSGAPSTRGFTAQPARPSSTTRCAGCRRTTPGRSSSRRRLAAGRRRQAPLLLPEPHRAHAPRRPRVTARRDTIGIVGAGPFGTALGSVLARAGRRVVLWSRDAAVVEAIQTTRRCPRLPDAALPEPLEATADPRRLAGEARFLVLAVSSTDVRDRARELGDVLDGSHIVVHAIGALASPTNERVSEVMAQGLPTLEARRARRARAARRSRRGQLPRRWSSRRRSTRSSAEGRRLLNAPPALRVYGSKDLVGVELASALSGAYTVALGLSDGLGIGPGTRAVLITRALAEASRLGVAAGAEARTFAGPVRAGQPAGPRRRSAALRRLPARAPARRRRGHRRTRAPRARGRRSPGSSSPASSACACRCSRASPRCSPAGRSPQAADLIGDTVAEAE